MENLHVIPVADKTSGNFLPLPDVLVYSAVIVESSRARQAFTNAENDLKKLQNEKKDTEESITKIFNDQGFGAQGEWKKLDGTCLEYDTGEYIYEACLFKEVRQKPKNGGSTFSLG